MKNFLIVLSTFLILVSCQKEDIQSYEIEESTTLETESKLQLKSTECDIIGPSEVVPNTTVNYQYTVDFPFAAVTWTVLSGDITINNNQGSSVQIYFGPNFNGGTIRARGDNGIEDCSDLFTITTNPVECPNNSCLALSTLECTDAIIYLDCTEDVAFVDWEYSIGPRNNVSFGRSYKTSNRRIIKSFSFPSGNWNNYYLVVYANITLTDGSTCRRSVRNRLRCSSPGDDPRNPRL